MSDREKLADLARRLKTRGLPSQESLAKGANVDQPLVSRARNGRIVRFTDRVRQLSDYVDMRIASLPASATQGRSGTSRRRETAHAAEAEAMRSCRDYLRDGCDPNVLLDQLAILRRAQRARSGRPPKSPSA